MFVVQVIVKKMSLKKTMSNSEIGLFEQPMHLMSRHKIDRDNNKNKIGIIILL